MRETPIQCIEGSKKLEGRNSSPFSRERTFPTGTSLCFGRSGSCGGSRRRLCSCRGGKETHSLTLVGSVWFSVLFRASRGLCLFGDFYSITNLFFNPGLWVSELFTFIAILPPVNPTADRAFLLRAPAPPGLFPPPSSCLRFFLPLSLRRSVLRLGNEFYLVQKGISVLSRVFIERSLAFSYEDGKRREEEAFRDHVCS